MFLSWSHGYENNIYKSNHFKSRWPYFQKELFLFGKVSPESYLVFCGKRMFYQVGKKECIFHREGIRASKFSDWSCESKVRLFWVLSTEDLFSVIDQPPKCLNSEVTCSLELNLFPFPFLFEKKKNFFFMYQKKYFIFCIFISFWTKQKIIIFLKL